MFSRRFNTLDTDSALLVGFLQHSDADIKVKRITTDRLNSQKLNKSVVIRKIRVHFKFSLRNDFDRYVIRAGIVVELSFVDAQKQSAVAGGDEFARCADKDKFVVVVADYGN